MNGSQVFVVTDVEAVRSDAKRGKERPATRRKRLAMAAEMNVKSPCDSCVNKSLCAEELKACAEFTAFVEAIPTCAGREELAAVAEEMKKDGSERVPTKEEYRKHFAA